MKTLSCLCLCCCVLGWLCRPTQAMDFPAWRAGDVADADLITPVALDVVDPAATAALQSARATQYPAVFRSLPELTNMMTRNFLAAFGQARTNFLTDLDAEFHSPNVNEAAIASADFSHLVTAFGVEHKNFPVPDELAAEWARGGGGEATRDKLLTSLLEAASWRVRPDALPKGMIVGETIRLVPVAGENQKLSFAVVQRGQLVPLASLATLSEAQALFRGKFPGGQQLFARALAASLQPNCLPDAPFTQLTRGTAVCQLIVSDHFDAGDAIVRQGDKIDARIQAALAALNEKLRSRPPSPSSTPPVSATPAAAPERLLTSSPAKPAPLPLGAPGPGTARLKSPPPAPATTPDRLLTSAPATSAPLPLRSAGLPDQNRDSSQVLVPIVNSSKPPLQAGLRHKGLIFTLAGASAVALLVALWQWLMTLRNTSLRRGLQATTPANQTPLPLPVGNKSDLTPQVTQAVREAVQQELASQRRELLLAQQAATDEIAALVQRLDELQMPMQERLHTYETRIQSLESELALRNEENRQLLKMKIQMVSRQLETERAATLVPPLPLNKL